MAMQADLKLVEHDEDGVDLAFRAEVLRGLSEPQKAIPARWFYDMAGSEFFEEITRLPEYYPSRVEAQLLDTYAPPVAELVGSGRVHLEFRSALSTKAPDWKGAR